MRYDMASGTFPEELDEGEPTRAFHPLEEREIKGILQREIEDALGGLSSQVSEERRKALRYYYGRQFGNEIEGRSQVILTDVADTIDWIMPSLMRMFTGGGNIARFRARKPEDVAAAEQATEYINMMFRDRMGGFQILHDWFKTALLEKNGIVKVYVDERTEPTRYTYRGLDEAGLNAVVSNPYYELSQYTEHEQAEIGPDGAKSEQMYDITVRSTEKRVEMKVDGVPPEEFLIARRAVKLDDATVFTGHRVKRTVSDLVAMGVPPDVASTLPSDPTPEFSQGRTERLSEDETFPVSTADRADAASREIWVTECYIRIDEDGDGYAELRKIVVVGEQSPVIIADEEANWQPFCSLTPNPMAHKFFGLSVADQVSDLQLIRSTLLRQMLDNLYIQNNGRYEVIEGAVEIDDLLTSTPGGIVRVTQQGAVTPLPAAPFGPMPMHMMEFLDGVRETRTGVSKWQQGPDASALSNNTRGAVSDVMQASYAKIENIARIFAETGVKQMFQKLLRILVEEDMKPDVMRMRGEWVDVDPSSWSADMDIEVQVGMGVGQAQERIQSLTTILMMQKEASEQGLGQTGMVKPQHIYNAVDRISDAMGEKTKNVFFDDPGDAEWPEPPPNPKILEHERRAEEDKARRMLDLDKHKLDASDRLEKLEIRVQQLNMDAELKREEIASHEKIEMERIESQERIARINSRGEGESDE